MNIIKSKIKHKQRNLFVKFQYLNVAKNEIQQRIWAKILKIKFRKN